MGTILMTGCSEPATPLGPAGGGEEFVLDFATFQSSVAPVLAQYGCHAMECHGGGIRGTYQLSPPDAPDAAYDFEQTRLQVDPYDPAASPVLQKPLAEAAGGTPHSWEPFASPSDDGYAALEAWILAGTFR